jgi:cation diffusion facilitator family transporter
MVDTGGKGATSRDSAVRRVLWIVLVLNGAVALAKLIVGGLSGSISMVADGFHSLTDGASNVVGLIAMSIARRPPDEDHPYGHRRFETLAALIIGGLLALTAWEVLQSCFERLRSGGAPEVSALSYGVMVATMAVNLGVSTWERQAGRKHKSEILNADSQHTRSDIFSSLAVIVSLIAADLGYPQLDLVAAVVITGVIGRAAFQILRENGLLLTDTALLPARSIQQIALRVPGVRSVHKIRSRSGQGGGHADLHVQVGGELPLVDAHEIAHRVAELLRRELGLSDVLVHVEPPRSEMPHSQGGDR